MLEDPREIFVMLLSEARQNAEKAAELHKELVQMAEDHPQIKELIEARAFLGRERAGNPGSLLQTHRRAPSGCQSSTPPRGLYGGVAQAFS